MLRASTLRSLLGSIVIGAGVAACSVPASAPMSELNNAKLIAGERAPCVSMPLDKFKTCGCHPRVASALDVMDGAGLQETARAELERCLSGESQARAKVGGRQIGEIEGALKTCLSQKVSVNESVASALGDIAKVISSRPPTAAETCNWSKCVYGPDASCEDTN